MNQMKPPGAGIEIDVIADYLEMKKAGITKISKMDSLTYYRRKIFNALNGNPEVIHVNMNRDQLVAAIAQEEEKLANMKEVLADMDAAEELV